MQKKKKVCIIGKEAMTDHLGFNIEHIAGPEPDSRDKKCSHLQ